MNYQTRDKIANLRTAIENKETREDIDKSYFKTKTIKKTFLSKNKSYFDKEELLYLGYDPETDTLLEETNNLTELEVPKNDTPSNLTKGKKVRNKKEEVKGEIEVAEVIEEATETNKLTELEITKNDNSNKLTLLDTTFFKDENNIKALVELITKYRNQTENNLEVLATGEINIPLEAKELELDGLISVRTNKEVYNKIVELATKNQIGKGQFVTFILWDFLKRNI
ncbi:hypothetical protein [Fusobacterium polymorphum]|uniref:hypothetical protein n=1 Tax=Fusobacterium nucleatum subsp. polymorphum TaxID=76857 RepID=UPI001C6EBCE0|nr:hypothetical protein [Fusobacterium polymorphum]QYR60242.1 hypothetical protein JY397_12125 [Fusobacterium polymorphum]